MFSIPPLNGKRSYGKCRNCRRGYTADEVRTLALRTRESTQEIFKTVQNLQTGSRRAVDVMEKGQQQTVVGLEKVNKSVESLQRITEAVARTAEMNNQIATAVESQSTMAEGINNNACRIKAISDQVSQYSEHTDDSVRQMNELAGNLKDTTSNFDI